MRPLRSTPGTASGQGDGSAAVDRVAEAVGVGDVIARHRTGDEARVIAPVEASPQAVGPSAIVGERVLEMRGLVELFVVIDTEGIAALSRGCSGACRLRREEPGGDRGHDGIGAEAVKIGDLDVEGVARNLRVVPVDGEGDGRIAEDAEVEGVVGVLPDVLAAEDSVFAQGLLQTGVKLVAEAGGEGTGDAGTARQQRVQHRIGAAAAGKDEVFVEGRLEGACVGDAPSRCLMA